MNQKIGNWWSMIEVKSQIMLLALVHILALGRVAWVPFNVKSVDSWSAIDWGATASASLWMLSAVAFLGTSLVLVRKAFKILPVPGSTTSTGSGDGDSDEDGDDEAAGPAARKAKENERDVNKRLFDQFLIFLGVAMAILVLDIALVIGGLIKKGYLEIPLDLGNDDEVARGLVLIVSCALALLGSVFFTANSLQRKRGEEPFDVDRFWSGFWFRMGESILFVLVLFLMIISGILDETINQQGNTLLAWLVPISLLLGMFVKTGERLIFGMAERLFAMMKGLLPVGEGMLADKPGHPRNLSTKIEDSHILVEWDEPLSQAPVDGYKIYVDDGTSPVAETHATVREFKIELARVKQKVTIKAFNSAGESEAASVDLPN